MWTTKEQQREYAVKVKAAGLCLDCHNALDRKGIYCCACLRKRRLRWKDRYSKLRNEVFMAYGGYKCACCGVTEPAFLTVDHIEGRKLKWDVGEIFWARLRREGFPVGYRILCYNCNVGRYRNGGVCPHEGL